jgi:predicted dehydrogenase
VLVRFENGAKGSFSVGQVIAGRKNAFEIEVNGRTGSLRWNQERQNELWVGRHDAPNSVLGSDPPLLRSGARPYAHMPAGHQEGWSDAFRNVVSDIYRWIRASGDPAAKPVTVCTFADACQVCCVIEAAIRSHAAGGAWAPVYTDSGQQAGPNPEAELVVGGIGSN